MKKLAENLWILIYPLPLLGANLQRAVTIIRLESGKLVIHSTGPFTQGQIAEIRAVGEPGWLLDTMLRHDTFAREGRAAFQKMPYLAPMGFAKEFATLPLQPKPEEWGDELEVLRIEGVPSMEEHLVYHRASRTLIVADLFFNFGPDAPCWTRTLMLAAVGRKHSPGMARSMRITATDKAALKRSLDQMMQWDFDRIIVGHGDVVEKDGKRLAGEALRTVGY